MEDNIPELATMVVNTQEAAWEGVNIQVEAFPV